MNRERGAQRQRNAFPAKIALPAVCGFAGQAAAFHVNTDALAARAGVLAAVVDGAAGFFVDVIMTWIQKEMESFYEKN